MQLVTINGVRGYIDDNGTAQLNLEDVARGLGFVQRKNNVDYIRWERVHGYLNDMGFPQLVGKDFIPENVFYRLSMKGETEAAIKFQELVADEILPSIRKTGSYSVQQQFKLPTTHVEAVEAYLGELKRNEVLVTENLMLEQRVKEYEPKISYLDTILKSKDTVTVTQIAKDYGLTGYQLNKILHEDKVQYKLNEQWLLYRDHQDKGYTKSTTWDVHHKDGSTSVKMNTQWTQKGRLFIHEILGKRGIVPFMDREIADEA